MFLFDCCISDSFELPWVSSWDALIMLSKIPPERDCNHLKLVVFAGASLCWEVKTSKQWQIRSWKNHGPLQHFLRYSTPSPISMYLFNLQHRDGTCNVLANSWLPEVEGTLYIDEVLHCSSGNGNGVDGRWRIRFNRFPSPMAKTAVNIHTNIIHPNMIKKYHSNISTWFAIYHCREGITNNFYSFMCSVELLYIFRSDPENSLNRGVLGLQNRGGQNLAFMIGERESEIWYQLEV